MNLRNITGFFSVIICVFVIDHIVTTVRSRSCRNIHHYKNPILQKKYKFNEGFGIHHENLVHSGVIEPEWKEQPIHMLDVCGLS